MKSPSVLGFHLALDWDTVAKIALIIGVPAVLSALQAISVNLDTIAAGHDTIRAVIAVLLPLLIAAVSKTKPAA